MALNIASLGEKARQAVPIDRFLQNVGVLARADAEPTEPAEPAKADTAAVADEFATEDLAGDAIPAPVDGEPRKRGFRSKRCGSNDDASLGDRLCAWWHGDDITAYFEPTPVAQDENGPLVDAEPWGPRRTKLSKLLWGESFLEPGGATSARRLFAQIMPSSKQSVLDLTAGLGGTALTLAKDLNLWMDAMEPDPFLAGEASEIAELYGLDEQVPVVQLDLGKVEIEEDRYNLIYSRERLFSIAEKIQLLQAAAKGLKEGGQLMLTDLMVPKSDNMDSDAFQSWVRAEPQWHEPWTLSLYTKTLEDLGLKVASRQNLTKHYLNDASAGWQRMSRILEREDFDSTLADQLLSEGDIWMARTRALEAGDLSYCRIVAWRGR
ncbi:MAG: methyltransferase domain-containing protein [Hyphomicrobiales bacterium]